MSLRFDETTRHAVRHTTHCLIGCGIGEILGSVIGAWFGWHNSLQTALAIALAFVFGYGLTYTSARRTGSSNRDARNTALRTDTVSIISMEIIDNAFVYVVPGAMAASVTSWLFWWSLMLSLGIAFLVTVPVNRFMMVRFGVGHGGYS